MELPFYGERLRAAGLDPLIPDAAARGRLHAIIYDELVKGVIRPQSKAAVLEMIAAARAEGADGVIFGCTEIGLLLDPAELDMLAVDTAIVHCEAGVAFALS
jgi:aspartate racemase